MIVAHREKLIDQTAKTLRTIGVTVETVNSKKKSLNHLSKCYVAMIQTLKNRLQKDDNFLKDVGLIIIDECHILLHEPIFEYYPNAKILGVTATPTLLKKVSFSKCAICKEEYDDVRICCNKETYEYTKRFTLSEIYKNIVIGKSIEDLIKDGELVQDLVYTIGGIDRSKLKIDSKTGDFDNASQDEQVAKGVPSVVENYKKLAFGKKTIIFNSSTKMNKIVLDAFELAGISNVKILDSVNECEPEKQVLEWFANTSNAILLNVDKLTAGFDEPTIQCVITNRATLSLSLFMQMVGRGGRITDKFFKDLFIHIDLGGNVANFGKWSEFIDWKIHFFGTNEKPKPKKEALLDVTQCKDCGYIHPKNLLVCPECGFEEPKKEKRITFSNEVAQLVDDIPLPDGYKIVQYTKKNAKDINFAYRILINQILDLFFYHKITAGNYVKTLQNGNFYNNLREKLVKPNKVFAMNFDRKSLKSFDTIIKIIKIKLDEFYKIESPTEITILKKL